MNKTIARCVFVCAVSAYLVLALATPWALSDSNTFLQNFVNHELLTFLGVIVTITLASAANLHLELNKLEEQAQRRGFAKTRTALKQSASWLVAMLLIALAIVVIKPLVAVDESKQLAAALFNGAALLIVIFNVLVLIDLTQAAFRLEADVDE